MLRLSNFSIDTWIFRFCDFKVLYNHCCYSSVVINFNVHFNYLIKWKQSIKCFHIFNCVYHLLSFDLFNKQINVKKIRAFKRGLETSESVGSLLLYFDYVGLPRRKKISAFEQGLVRNQTYTCIWTFDGTNHLHSARFFPPKDLSKAQTFFSKDNFSQKDLVFFDFFWSLLKAPKDLVFIAPFGPFSNRKKKKIPREET